LIQTFRDWPEAASLMVHAAWFADAHEEGVASIDGIDWPRTLAGDLGVRPAAELGDLLERCTFSPGLDLWDPLEEGLCLVAEPLLRSPQPGTAILIVGNSPPNLPLDGASPLYDLLEFRGFSTTTRRKNNLFTNLVRDIDAHAIPFVYLFLGHDRCREDEEVAALHVHQGLQEQVRRALGHYLKVIPAPADAEGVARGLREALDFLSRPPVSGVVLSAREHP
jgi:hypothetical protein